MIWNIVDYQIFTRIDNVDFIKSVKFFSGFQEEESVNSANETENRLLNWNQEKTAIEIKKKVS